jgi:hypothetical protein
MNPVINLLALGWPRHLEIATSEQVSTMDASHVVKPLGPQPTLGGRLLMDNFLMGPLPLLQTRSMSPVSKSQKLGPHSKPSTFKRSGDHIHRRNLPPTWVSAKIYRTMTEAMSMMAEVKATMSEVKQASNNIVLIHNH